MFLTNSFGQLPSDTLRVSYYKAIIGEFGGINRGIILIKTKNKYKAQYIGYKESTYLIPNDSLIYYYKKNKNNYTLIKEIDSLSKNQINTLNSGIIYIKQFKKEKNLYSNAPEHYYVKTESFERLIIDTGKTLKFYNIVENIFGIEEKLK